MHDVAFIVTVADHDAIGGVEVSRRRSVSSGIRRVDLQDLTHLPATVRFQNVFLVPDQTFIYFVH